jgi:flagellar hook protein FlgE
MNAAGYLVNSAGQYLNGWAANATTGVINQNALVPIQVSQSSYDPIATKNVTLSANLPATPTSGTATPGYTDANGNVIAATPLTSQITVYDSLGTAHAVTLNWTQTPDPNSTTIPPAALPNKWTVNIEVPGAQANPTVGTAALQDAGSADVTFGAASGTDLAAVGATAVSPSEGTIGLVTADATDPGTPSVTASTYSQAPIGTLPVSQAATVTFTTNFGSGNQTISLNLGTYGGTGGVTQFAGSAYSLLGLTQDGVAPGSFSGVTTQANGNVIVNYNNGQTRTIAQIPLVTFNAPDSLQSQNGESFTATPASGSPLAVAAGSSGAGNLVVGSVEGSNVDIATEFSNLIVAQQAYSSNAKVVTTANTMLQVTLQMVT